MNLPQDETGRGRRQGRLLHIKRRGDEVKQYLVMKMVEGLDKVAGMMALPGFYTLEAAQALIDRATANEPGAHFMIQEVGAA